ncbi:MAG TPA: cation:dicarboxylase symporter family transporter, partial [Acidobacteriaceae bacterium]|nr:cation:dicarboxylase symporter family transporter [Acidobacteriaceae bacterium]
MTKRSRWLRAAGLVGGWMYMLGAVLGVYGIGGSAVLRVAGIVLAAVWARRSLTAWIFVAMLAGVELGVDAPGLAVQSKVFSDIFLRLIRMIVAPLILGTLVTGIAGHGSLRQVGRIGVKSLVYFEVVTTLALLIGVVAINLSKAGVGLAVSAAPNVAATASNALTPASTNTTVAEHGWQSFLLNAFPENIAKSIADNQILQVAVFAVLLGIALSMLTEERRRPLLELAESVTAAMFAITNIVMYVAPLGVGGALAYTVGERGLAVLLPLAKLLGTLYGALAAFLLLVLLPAALLFRVPLRAFVEAVAEPATIGFATSTSEAALPSAMEEMELFGVPRRIVSFVIPAGYSFNLAGSSVYLALASIFVAQAAGMRMSVGAQLAMVFTLMLTSKGVAGVPRATLVVLLATASTFRLPTEPIFLILGVDAFADMGRTAVNVIGNCLAAAIVARSEGELGAEAETATLEA